MQTAADLQGDSLTVTNQKQHQRCHATEIEQGLQWSDSKTKVGKPHVLQAPLIADICVSETDNVTVLFVDVNDNLIVNVIDIVIDNMFEIANDIDVIDRIWLKCNRFQHSCVNHHVTASATQP